MMNNQFEIENNTVTNNKKAEGTCPGCGRHCPLSAPHCGKGEAYARMQQEGGELSQERAYSHDRDDRDGRHEHGRRGEDGSFEGRRERGGEEHGRDRDREFSYDRNDRDGRREHGRPEGEETFEGRRGREDRPHRHWYERPERGEERRGPHAGRKHGPSDWESRPGEEALPPLDDHADDLSIRLRLACDRILRSGGKKRGQERILEILKDSDGISQRDLLYHLHIQPGSLSEILNKLETAGEIERVPDERDRRRQLVMLTEKGRTRAEGLSGEEQQDPYAALTKEEKKTLSDLLDKLIDSTEE